MPSGDLLLFKQQVGSEATEVQGSGLESCAGCFCKARIPGAPVT